MCRFSCSHVSATLSVIETLTRCPGNACREEPYCTAGSETPCCERQSDRETESETEGLVRQKSGRHIHSIQGEEDKSSCFSVPEEPSAAWEQWIHSNPPPQSGTITKRTLIHFSGQTAAREQRRINWRKNRSSWNEGWGTSPVSQHHKHFHTAFRDPFISSPDPAMEPCPCRPFPTQSASTCKH